MTNFSLQLFLFQPTTTLYRELKMGGHRSVQELQLLPLKRWFKERAYIANLDEWCPNPKEVEEGVFECSGR